jgi:outer membrane protein assembly factor BamB
MRSWKGAALIAAAIALVVGGTGVPASAAQAVGDWPQYLSNPFHQSSSQQGVITAATVPSLHPVWHVAAGNNVESSVSVVGGRAYVAGKNAVLYAINVSTGVVAWQRQLDKGSSTYCPAKGSTATPAVLPDPVTGVVTVYAAGAHYLYAFDAASGTQRWSRAIGPATAAGEGLYYNWSSPAVSGGRIFMGLAANCEADLIRGGLVSVSQHTGALLHTYYDTPAGTVGGSIWSSATTDGTSVWVTTGNPDPFGSAIYHSYSIVRLSAATLAEQDWWTVPEGQSADLDFGSSPALFPATVGGTRTLLVGACNKNGVFYAWRRANLAAGPLWQRTLGGNDTSPCLTSAAVDSTSLYVAAGPTTVGGASVPGAIRALDPATGALQWERALPCGVLGTPTVDAVSHVVAVPLYQCTNTADGGAALVRSTDGTPLRTLAGTSHMFAQPVFAAGRLFVASKGGGVTAYAG